MLKRITIENYKAFKNPATIELRPITVLLGKNSSGKSSICKLLSVLSYVLSDSGKGVFSMLNGDVKLGTMYSDLFYTDRQGTGTCPKPKSQRFTCLFPHLSLQREDGNNSSINENVDLSLVA